MTCDLPGWLPGSWFQLFKACLELGGGHIHLRKALRIMLKTCIVTRSALFPGNKQDLVHFDLEGLVVSGQIPFYPVYLAK